MKCKERDHADSEVSFKCALATSGRLLRCHQHPMGCAHVRQGMAPDTDPAPSDQKTSAGAGPDCVGPGLWPLPPAAAAGAPWPWLVLWPWISDSLPFPAKEKTWQWGNKGGFLLEQLSVW